MTDTLAKLQIELAENKVRYGEALDQSAPLAERDAVNRHYQDRETDIVERFAALGEAPAYPPGFLAAGGGRDALDACRSNQMPETE